MRQLSGYGHMARMGDFVFGILPNLIGQQRDDGESFAGERHEFNGAAFAVPVNEHDRANVARAQAMFRRSVVNTTLSSSLIVDFLRFRAFALKKLFPDLRTFPVRAEAFDLREFLHRLQRFLERGAVVFHHARASLELIHRQPGKRRARAAGRQRVARPSHVIAQHRRRPLPRKIAPAVKMPSATLRGLRVITSQCSGASRFASATPSASVFT